MDFKAVFGKGIQGVVAADWLQSQASKAEAGEGKAFYIGNKAFLEEKQVSITKEAMEQINALADGGQTPLLVADDKKLWGVIGVSDQIRESSREAIAAWHDMGVKVIMLTGDNKRTAEAVRRQLNLEEVVAEVLPQDKEKKVSSLKSTGKKVAMIGDGINDAPALAAADVGMAIGAGTDVAMESADVILMKSDLRDAVTAMRLSRQVIRNIKENLFWAFFYNCIGIPLAAGLLYPAFGLRLNPMFGAAAMSLSSIFVVSNALRLRGFHSKFKTQGSTQAECRQENSCADKKSSMESEETKMEKTISIEGMMCSHCTGRVQKALEAVAGVSKVEVSLENKNAVVTLAENVADDTLKAAVTDAGYEVKSIR